MKLKIHQHALIAKLEARVHFDRTPKNQIDIDANRICAHVLVLVHSAKCKKLITLEESMIFCVIQVSNVWNAHIHKQHMWSMPVRSSGLLSVVGGMTVWRQCDALRQSDLTNPNKRQANYKT